MAWAQCPSVEDFSRVESVRFVSAGRQETRCRTWIRLYPCCESSTETTLSRREIWNECFFMPSYIFSVRKLTQPWQCNTKYSCTRIWFKESRYAAPARILKHLLHGSVRLSVRFGFSPVPFRGSACDLGSMFIFRAVDRHSHCRNNLNPQIVSVLSPSSLEQPWKIFKDSTKYNNLFFSHTAVDLCDDLNADHFGAFFHQPTVLQIDQ